MKREIQWNFKGPCPGAIHDMRIRSATYDNTQTVLHCTNGLFVPGETVPADYRIRISVPMSDMLIILTKKIRWFPFRTRRYLSGYVSPPDLLHMLKRQSLEIYDIYRNDSASSYLIQGEFLNAKHYTGYSATIQFSVSEEDRLTLIFED